MPNTTVRAAAEGMPKVNRRSFLGSSVALALPTAALAIVTHTEAAAVAETPLDRVYRLADELSAAMGVWRDEMEIVGCYASIECVVQAERADGVRPIRFQPIRHFTPEQRVANAQRELVDANKARYPEISDWRVVRPEDDGIDGSKLVGMFMIVGHPKRRVVS